MGERLVRLGHFMNFVAFANGIALALIGFQDFRRQRFFHGNALARVRKINQPSQRQGELPLRRHFQRHL